MPLPTDLLILFKNIVTLKGAHIRIDVGHAITEKLLLIDDAVSQTADRP